MLNYKITKRQLEYFNFIKFYINENGYAPTLQETANAMNVKSVNTVSKIIEQLDFLKYIVKIPNKHRGITIPE